MSSAFFRFDHPLFFIIGLCIALPLSLIALRGFLAMARIRRLAAALLRILLFLLFAALLAGPTLTRHSSNLTVIAVIDVSDSVQRFANFGLDAAGKPRSVLDAAHDFLAQAALNKQPDDRLGVVLFDGQASALFPPSSNPLPLLAAASLPPPRDGSDLAAAIDLAASMLSATDPAAAGRSRLLLISDGNYTAANPLDRARLLAHRHAAGFTGLDTLPIDYPAASEIVLESLEGPARAAAGERIRLRALISSSSHATGSLSLLDNNQPIDLAPDLPGLSRPVSLEPGLSVHLLDITLDPSRLHRFELLFEPDPAPPDSPPPDRISDNNRARAFTLAAGKGNVLIINAAPDQDQDSPAALLASILQDAGLAVQSIRPEAFLPDSDSSRSDLLTLQTFDAIILQNVPADALSPAHHAALSAYVRDMGGGLLMIGGPDSFAPGAWRSTPIEPLLPVRLDLPDELISPSAAVVIVLDQSGSMRKRVMGSSRSQMEIAAQGAASAIASLDKTDLVGVVAFSDQMHPIIPLAKNSDPKRAADILNSIDPDGGTIIGPALSKAAADLASANAQEKHIILLSDGQSLDADALPDIVRAFSPQGIRLTTIAVGDEADAASLAGLARQGAGKFYRVIDPNLLPRVLLKAVRIVRSPLIRKEPFIPLIAAASLPAHNSPADDPGVADLLARAARASPLPPIDALVLTRLRTDPSVSNIMLTPKGDPLLSYWNVGLGKVAAWTSDAHDWSRAFSSSPLGRQMWTQLVKQISRAQPNQGLELAASIDADELVIRVNASDDQGQALDNLRVAASVYSPANDSPAEKHELILEPVASGEYVARLPAAHAGTYVVAAVARPQLDPASPSRNPALAALASTPIIAGVSKPQGREFRRLASNRTLMQDLATPPSVSTAPAAGRVLDWSKSDQARLFDRSLPIWSSVQPSLARLPIWRSLLWTAFFVMLLDIANRRIAWDRFVSREFTLDLRRSLEEASRDRTDLAAAAAQRLRAADPRRSDAANPRAALTEQDALDIIARERLRRRDAATQPQHNRIPSPTTPRSAPPPARDDLASTPPADQVSPTNPASPSTPSPLAAAKRRAQQRMRDDTE